MTKTEKLKIAQLEKALDLASAYTRHLQCKIYETVNHSADEIKANWLEIAAQDIK